MILYINVHTEKDSHEAATGNDPAMAQAREETNLIQKSLDTFYRT